MTANAPAANQPLPAVGPVGKPAYQPKAILPGGMVIPLFQPDSPMLNQDRIHEPEVYTMSKGAPGRVQQIVNIHNPSIEFHPADNNRTGATIIFIAGGGHKRLIVSIVRQAKSDN